MVKAGKRGTVDVGYVYKQKRVAPRRPFGRNLHRVHEIEALIRHRNAGGACDPADADADTWLAAAARDLQYSHTRDEALRWAQKWTPGLSIEVVLTTLDAAEGRKPLTAALLGELLCVTAAERLALGLTQMRAFDRTKRQMTEERKMRDRERKRVARARAGATPRQESATAAKPWEAEGVSRRTWYRRRGTETSVPIIDIAADETVPRDADAGAPLKGARLADDDRGEETRLAERPRKILDEMAARRRTDAEIAAEQDRWIAEARDRAIAEDRPFLDVFREDALARHLRSQAEFADFVHRVATGMHDAMAEADEMDAAATVPYTGEA